ncbi:Uncharacterised nucleotidyltransferase [Sphingomonas guangdongensis]|uniref:Uncharacterized nucleotidyltransferase n=1 Tax=Sphingomonas guangdongensis TaxID=1141890 RepID=A0A285QXZ6_9SPHN|nr:nucleotidyltransferase family protein [Sphingomonas guangdongensis]SOB86845.1 Uncharacterised nucleotidyltransferase [Sphingomonas guangdongensis]
MGGGLKDARILVDALRDPTRTAALEPEGWTALIACARAEQLVGTLAERVAGLPMPPRAAELLEAARRSADTGRTAALWEAACAARALAPAGLTPILLKGTAYVAAGLKAGVGRSIGDLDILVPRDRIDQAEQALLGAGWEWVKPDPYDDEYYRRWMHELPPLIHRERDRMIDVHHTVLPLTARITPDAAAMIADAEPVGGGLAVLAPADMICHAVAHLFADGDLAGGLRNLWDIRCLIDEFGTDGLAARAARHGLGRELARAVRLADALYGSGTDLTLVDRWYVRRLLARDGWGRATRPVTRLAFYIRSHWLRMPPLMLARHLLTKWRKGGPGPG